ncbi:MAG: WYL domain-containing protein [Mariprofundales bacterium]
MSKSTHDTLVYRLSHMLIKLNQGVGLDPSEMTKEFGVSLRTIQRDINLRFAYLPLYKKRGRYFLDASFLGKLNNSDIRNFAKLAGVRSLFPSLSDDFLRDIFDSRMQGALLVKGHNYENIAGKGSLFRQLEKAIVTYHRIRFQYQKELEEKSYGDIAPYKLLNHKGIWYLAAQDGDKLKTFGSSTPICGN